MDIILLMTSSGSLLFLLLVVIECFKRELFNQCYRYGILKIALFLHFIPLALIMALVSKLIIYLFPEHDFSNFLIHGSMKTIMMASDGLHVNTTFRNELVTILIWLIMAIIIFSLTLWKRVKFRNTILKVAKETLLPDIISEKDKYCSHLGIKQKIHIYITEADISPFTAGILKPVIVLPEMQDSFQRNVCIYHELCHIKHGDGIILFLRALAVGIYWFNPLIYILDLFLQTSCELACDEVVTAHMSKDEKKKYGHLILDMSDVDFVNREKSYVNAFSYNKKILKERIDCIMLRRKPTTKFAILLSAGMVLCSASTAFAYEPPREVIVESETGNDIFLESAGESIRFTQGNANEGLAQNGTEKIVYDSQFTDKYGNTYTVDESTPHRACEHSYVEGVYEKHKLNSDGSCITKAYSAKRCTKCGKVVIGSLTSTTEYTKCPH